MPSPRLHLVLAAACYLAYTYCSPGLLWFTVTSAGMEQRCASGPLWTALVPPSHCTPQVPVTGLAFCDVNRCLVPIPYTGKLLIHPICCNWVCFF